MDEARGEYRISRMKQEKPLGRRGYGKHLMKKRGSGLYPGCGMICAIVTLPLALAFVPITAGTAYAASPNQSFELNSGLADTTWKFSFIQLTDLHIGEGFNDYGSTGYNDFPQGDEGTSAQNLRQAVQWINANYNNYAVRFVVVTGDLTESAEKSEFLKCREILDTLVTPYVPMLGNHDVWPYYKDVGGNWQNSDAPTGDAYFKEIFGPRLDSLRDSGFFGRWDDGTRNTSIWNGEADTLGGADVGCNSYFQNFSFDFAGYHFIAADFNTRNRALIGEPGAMGYADLFDSVKCQGTWPWYKNHLSSYPYKAAENVINFSHQPLCKDSCSGQFTFSSNEYNTVADFIHDNYYKYHTGLWAGGHFHQYTFGWSPAFEYDITDSSGDYVCPGVHTEAVKDDPGFFRLFKVWAKTSASNPNGVILFENENFGGKSELFVRQNPRLLQSFIGDNTASSLRMMGSGTVELFKDDDFGGERLETDTDIASLAASGFDDAASSVRFDVPLVTGITPGSGTTGSTVNATISGQRFRPGASVRLGPRFGKEVRGKSVYVASPSSINCTFNLKDASPDKYSIIVTNTEGLEGTLADCFEVLNASAGHNIWYFAEGYTGDNFQEYLCIGNPSEAAATTNVTYMFTDGTSKDSSYNVPADSRMTVDVNNEVGAGREVSIKVFSETTNLVAERPMYFNYQGVWTGGSDAVGATSPNTSWYFAEGTTLPNFDQYVTVLNPTDSAANLTFHYMVEGQGEQDASGQVGAHSRATFKTRDQIGSNLNASLYLSSDQNVVAERPMYFNYQGLANNNWTGGHDVVGANSPAKQWYLAEGTTRGGFEEWLCLQNPSTADITVSATYQLGSGQGDPISRSYTVPASQRLTVSVNMEIGPEKDDSVFLSSETDFIAERPMYFNYQGPASNNWTGGHCVLGANSSATTWFFAEGTTRDDFNEWLCLQNPGSEAAAVTITYYPASGSPVTKPWTVAPNSRLTVDVNADAGANQDVSARVTSDKPIIVERPMYFDYKGWTGGHDVVGFVPFP